MTSASAEIATPHGSRYLQQLCKHWSHKFPVTFTPEHGTIQLTGATCALDAKPDSLGVRIETDDPSALARFETVVAQHIVRFAFREELVFDWQRDV